MLVEEVTVLLLLLPNIAVMLTVQLLPAGARREMLVIAPSTTFVVCIDGVPHKCIQLMETV